ncbi:right-handed parallel beta-helix repeat-containing protein [Glaciecola sp. 1036]|uniref:right-handed parallel beta-helix repeat-containing protein n=1 Tax=Alteromonadaceae TaxID=72275 RepID=UPI003D065EEC
MWQIRNFLLFLLLTLVLSCTSVFEEKKYSNTLQPGEQLKQLSTVSSSPPHTSLSQVSHLKYKAKKFLNNNKDDLNDLVANKALTRPQMLANIKSKTSTDEKIQTFALISALLPLDQPWLAYQLMKDNVLSRSDIKKALRQIGASYKQKMSFPIETLETVRITPLINSASITVNTQANQLVNVKIKPKDKKVRYQQVKLHWEPIYGTMSGSAFDLNPATEYEVVIESELLKKEKYSFKTRANKPRIEKIIYLKDLYKGGSLDVLDLEKEITKNGWTQIDGTGVTITGDKNSDFAINLGNLEYVYLTNIKIDYAKRFGIYAHKASNIWIDSCDIRNFGRNIVEHRNGIGYAAASDTSAVNRDAGIFLNQSGQVVIEHCKITSPNHSANSWKFGHPRGASALQISADHPNKQKQGQYIIRFNQFYGSDNNRFNDVIESKMNGRRHGGFIRDSVIHNNYLAYSNDDLIELDGGQSNVAFYNNKLEYGFCGISIAPNMWGPSYIFNNTFLMLGDSRGRSYSNIKSGGLFVAPGGVSLIADNQFYNPKLKIAFPGLQKDSSVWVEGTIF